MAKKLLEESTKSRWKELAGINEGYYSRWRPRYGRNAYVPEPGVENLILSTDEQEQQLRNLEVQMYSEFKPLIEEIAALAREYERQFYEKNIKGEEGQKAIAKLGSRYLVPEEAPKVAERHRAKVFELENDDVKIHKPEPGTRPAQYLYLMFAVNDIFSRGSGQFSFDQTIDRMKEMPEAEETLKKIRAIEKPQ